MHFLDLDNGKIIICTHNGTVCTYFYAYCMLVDKTLEPYV